MIKQYDNRALVVPKYTEEQLRELPQLVFPYSDDYMTYDKRTHQYYLTNEALIEYGIDINPDGSSNEVKTFIRDVTNAVYSAIKVKAGNINYPIMMYRIAKGLGVPSMSQYDFRNQFLFDVLLTQARHMQSGNAKRTPKIVTTETGRLKSNDLNYTDLYWLDDDVIINLESLNLFSRQRVVDACSVDWTSY